MPVGQSILHGVCGGRTPEHEIQPVEVERQAHDLVNRFPLSGFAWKILGAALQDLRGTYPDAEDARIVVAIVHAARLVRDLNFKYLSEGRGAPVTARFGSNGITILDPNATSAGEIRRCIYPNPL